MDCFLEDDGGPEFVAVEAVPEGGDVKPQALWVLARRPFHGPVQAREPVLWVTYQPRYMASERYGDVMLTPEVWRQLNRAVEREVRKLRRAQRRRRFWPTRKGKELQP